jgi:hypothetical protein
MRVEISGRDAFWRNAVMVEWEHRYPERKLMREESGSYLIERDWFDDLARIAGECFSKVVVAPPDPSRRLWFRRLISSSG